MAQIVKGVLEIRGDASKHVATVRIHGVVKFNQVELCMMKACPEAPHFRLKARLRAVDYGSPDEVLYIFPEVFRFPDSSPMGTETADFTAELGYSLLNEDPNKNPRDELIGELQLWSTVAGLVDVKFTNVVTGYF